MSILRLKNLCYRYEDGDKDVLKNINITFKTGKVIGIVGKSGAGKSTLLSLISGLDTSTSGEVLYKDKDIKSIDRDLYRAKNIGVIFQGYNLLLNATAIENIILSMDISGVKKEFKEEYAYEILEKVGIDRKKAKRRVLKLSGGEQQRVGIARALAHDPDIIIADEPTGNLDGDTEETIMDILAKLAHEEDKCVIIVTHSKKVCTYFDETWGINSGRLIYVK
ncbi:ABC transporter ATP-binding protein [Clostridium botulinum]|uniref:ABC transporter, ATP-binding protein n=1 Tax=Clostridium botulinum (strain Langeland / NCTC 10281 / Type F) TaxID=441772 RepID=A7GD37_CLOBL|nr:ABC transporter ATP-binding protein [Clostridium botulinum]ABS41045.1 ABC transporter, ATP-binding protein [Clostridium botulinum F str. Langeland]ADF99148.1 ABC transporter, ATP-binding protein [Clostridium botulinum F str. 230613]KKM43294.1 ABC transporter [Clostridium botulinum]MBY6791188.1 ABC transporter ATP-binding protein [Clostridium botulinum]MBY6936419.1 ABC transporter ATP-binding protein [Clostridium botulinum]